MRTSWLTRLFEFFFGKKNSNNYTGTNPPYVEYADNIIWPAPDSLSDSLIYCFYFTSNGGDKSKLQQLLDQRLNFPHNDDYRYEAFAADVMISFASTHADRSIPDKELGKVQENEVVFWVPALEKIKKNGRWVSNRLVWFVPYIVVDNPWAMAAGREIYGLPKSVGKFQIPEDPRQATDFTSTTYGFKTYRPGATLQELPFISIARGAASGAEQSKTFSNAKEGFSAIKGILMAAEGILKDFSFRLCLNEIDDLLHMRTAWVMLKQFREIADSTTACYQAIIEGPLKVTAFHGGGLLNSDYRLTIHEMANMPIAKDLGLEDGQQARASLWLRVDFDAELGNVLWKA